MEKGEIVMVIIWMFAVLSVGIVIGQALYHPNFDKAIDLTNTCIAEIDSKNKTIQGYASALSFCEKTLEKSISVTDSCIGKLEVVQDRFVIIGSSELKNSYIECLDRWKKELPNENMEYACAWEVQKRISQIKERSSD